MIGRIFLLTASLCALVHAIPTNKSLGKRHSDCFSYNIAGCQYPELGTQGAVVTVRRDVPEDGGYRCLLWKAEREL